MVYRELGGKLLELAPVFDSDLPLKNVWVTRLLVEVLELLLTNFTASKTDSRLGAGRKAYAVTRLQQITQYVNNHYTDKLSLKDLAEY